jgi:hypothetical protein
MSTSTLISITTAQARWHRLAQHGLRAPFADAVQAAQAITGVQAQIAPAAGIALANRVPKLAASTVNQLLFHERTLVRLWGQRGTLHTYATSDWPLLYAAQSDLPTYWERVALKRGDDLAEHNRLVDAVAELLRHSDSLGRSDLRASGLPIDELHLSGWGGIFAVLARRGLACHAPPQQGEARMVHRERWVPDLAWNPPSAEAANHELARRYFAAYGPATLADFAYWRGRSLGDARRWVAALGDELAPVSVDGTPMLARSADLDQLRQPAPAAADWPLLLVGRFEPLLLGHKVKDDLIDPTHYQAVWRPAGHIEATVLIQGRIAGTWRYDWQGTGIRVQVQPFRALNKTQRRHVERRAAQIAAHFAVPLEALVISSEAV